MFPRARVRPGAEETPEDEEASLLQQRDLTLRSALDQIQQRRRTPRHSSPPRQQPPQAPQEGEGEDTAPAVPAPPPHPQGGPLEALRQREWLLNLQEQQELQRLKVATPPEQDSGDKEEQLLFNGETPPSPPPTPAAAAPSEVVPQAERLPSPPPFARSSLGSMNGRGSGGWRGRGGRGGSGGGRGGGWGGSSPPRSHRGGRGAPRRPPFHPHRGWPPTNYQHRREGMDRAGGPPAKSGVSHPPSPRLGQPGKSPIQEDDRASLRSVSSSSSVRPPRGGGGEEDPAESDWQERAVPRSEQDEASMLARALELSRLDEVLSCAEEERLCAAALEQSRREHRGGSGRRGARGGGGPPFPRRNSWRASATPPEELPNDLLSLGNKLCIVGSINAASHPMAASGGAEESAAVALSPSGSAAEAPAAEPDVSFDQWLSLCGRYMPLLAQGMVELHRTCAAVRSVVPAFDGGPIPFPPPVWPPLQLPPPAPPTGVTPPLPLSGLPPSTLPGMASAAAALLAAFPPPAMAPLSVASPQSPVASPTQPPPPLASLPLAPPATLIAELTGSALRTNHYGQLPRPVTNGGGDGGQTSGEAGPRQKNSTRHSSHANKRHPGNTEQPNTNCRGRRSSRRSSSVKKNPANS